MSNPSDGVQLKSSFFHSVDKTMIVDTMDSYESMVKSGHVITASDIIGETLPYLETEAAVDQWITDNPGIIRKYVSKELTEIPGSNKQSWYINDGGWINPIILNSLITHPITKAPSYGYIFRLYNTNDTQIGMGEGRWLVNPYQGIIYFDRGFTPDIMGYGTPKVTCYTYVGQSLLEYINTHITSPSRVNGVKITSNDGLTEPLANDTIPYDLWFIQGV